MNQLITKLPTDTKAQFRPAFPFHNARSALKAYLRTVKLSPKDEILLPSYIGWSKNEGSGVFDPVVDVGISYRFYRIRNDLAIDLDDLETQLGSEHARVFLVIHYFGFPDPGLEKAIDLARRRNLIIIEDEAHALFTDYCGGIVGRFGDAALLSLHKMLPVPYGGMLILNQPSEMIIRHISSSDLLEPVPYLPNDFDLLTIANKRRDNAQWLAGRLQSLVPDVSLLVDRIPEGVVPQTLPVLINVGSRDSLYFNMNDLGYGVVSLYHTMIRSISPDRFPDSHWLSHRILNLPIHQDASRSSLTLMVESLQRLLESSKEAIR